MKMGGLNVLIIFMFYILELFVCEDGEFECLNHIYVLYFRAVCV